ncbi:hypothetical protein [Citrobacter koseri]|uniref:hypothetical protein n=1 Tax=Citrobacter koseri TaxID=545 RepID=UPI0023B011EE|nr:hypothetical protein [Citrobacter koseri]
MNKYTRGWLRRGCMNARAMVSGSLPGLLLCLLAGLGLKAGIAEAVPETYLAAQGITVNGRVTAPSCTVRLENNQMTFGESATSGSGAEGATAEDGAIQTLKLNVSECDADGVGMLFKADYWPDMPERGVLRGVKTRRASGGWYYTVSPGREDNAGWPLKLSQDSDEKPVTDIRLKGTDERQYYKLSEVNYWYDLKSPLRDGDEMIIPLTVSLHKTRLSEEDTRRESKRREGELDGTFTIQLSWR